MNDLLFSEILELFEKAETRKEKIAVLQKYGSLAFQEFLCATFHPQITFDVGVPQYRPSIEPAGLNYSYLHNEMSKMYRFIVNHPKRSANLTGKKQTQLLVVILESLHKDEAELLVKMFKKDLGVKYLTLQIVREAFPNLNLPAK
jgi:hypothetical protein